MVSIVQNALFNLDTRNPLEFDVKVDVWAVAGHRGKLKVMGVGHGLGS